MKNVLSTSLFLFLMIFSVNSSASKENMKEMGSMQIHYMALGSAFLTPEIATAYSIERSKYNALINISVLDATQQSTPAKVVSISGKSRNNLGQIKSLAFDEVKEGDAIYYLAQVKFSHEETIHFDLTITDGKESHQLKFKQKFYVD
jgi:hypothetical protein